MIELIQVSMLLVAFVGGSVVSEDPASSTRPNVSTTETESAAAMRMGLAGQPALGALRLGLSLGHGGNCESLATLNDLMLASDSHGWLLDVIGEERLNESRSCLPTPILLAWAREKLRAFDPRELPKPEEMIGAESDSVEFVYDDDEAVSFEFDTPSKPSNSGGPKSSAITFDVEPADADDVEFEFGVSNDPHERDLLSSGEIAVHFESTLSKPFSGHAESQRLFLWASFDYLRGELDASRDWFLKLLQHSSDLGNLEYQKKAEVGLARLAFDSQRFFDSFERFDRISVQPNTIETQWLPELVWSAYFAGRDDFLNRLFEWISADRIHPLALGDALGLVPRILEEQCRREDALKVTSYLIEAMRQPPLLQKKVRWGPYSSLMTELEAQEPQWVTEAPYDTTLGWLRARAERYRNASSSLEEASLRQALAQLLRTRIDMRLGRGLMRCRL